MNDNLLKTRCMVVGATNPKSIGYAVASALCHKGAGHVTIVGRDPEKLGESRTRLSSESSETNISGVLGDLKHPETMSAVVDAAAKEMGGIDLLVCCGGNGYSEYLGLDPNDPESYTMMQKVAVLSPMFLAEAAMPYLKESIIEHGGTVVMAGSVSANVPWPNTAPYNFAMAAKNTMIQTLAFKYQNDNIRVNGVLAGVIHTGALDVMAAKKNQAVEDYAALRASAQPLGRCGSPEDVANAVLYLASPASGFTTGELLRVDGGLHLTNWWNQQAMLNQYRGAKNSGSSATS